MPRYLISRRYNMLATKCVYARDEVDARKIALLLSDDKLEWDDWQAMERQDVDEITSVPRTLVGIEKITADQCPYTDCRSLQIGTRGPVFINAGGQVAYDLYCMTCETPFRVTYEVSGVIGVDAT